MITTLSFSLFDKKYDWQFLFYLRGLIFNVWMAKIVYPGFHIVVHVERTIYLKYRLILDPLDIQIVMREEDTLCRMMLWRLKPIFESNADYVFARDCDALITSREAAIVKAFIVSGKTIQGIHDNPAHSIPLMGGLSGYRCTDLDQRYGNWDDMLSLATAPIDKHGSDQTFLNEIVFNDFKHSYFSQQMFEAKNGSDLCISFVGAAGVNEFETLRYLRSKGIDLSLFGIGSKFKEIFYWL